MSIANEVFETGFDLYKYLTSRAQNKNVHAKMLIRGLRDNLKRLEQRHKKGISEINLIRMLSNECYLKAIEEGYNLKNLAKNARIDDSIIQFFPKAERYKNWGVERLLGSIDEKIVALKDLLILFDTIEKAPINISLRFENLYTQLLLLSFLIRDSKK